MPANPFVPLDGHNTVNDMIDRINAVYQYYADLGTGAYHDVQVSADDVIADKILLVGAFGIGGQALLSTASANTFKLGSYTSFYGTEAQCVTKNLPAIPLSLGTENRRWTVITFGRNDSTIQFATEVLSVGLPAEEASQQFKRVYNGTTWSSWLPVGSGGGAKLGVFYEGNVALATSYTIPIGKNAMTAGPVAINSGVTVTVSPGSVWTIV